MESILSVNNIFDSLMNDKLQNTSPETIARIICLCASDIERIKRRVLGIKDRNLFERMKENNTRDLAEAIFDVIELNRRFLEIVNIIILINLDNRIYLQKLEKQILTMARKMNMENNEMIYDSMKIIEKATHSSENNKTIYYTSIKGLKTIITILTTAIVFIFLILFGVISF